MASLASSGLAVGAGLLHVFAELSLVRIFVATGALHLLPVIDHSRLWFELGRLFVAVGARNGDVAASQYEARLLVPHQ